MNNLIVIPISSVFVLGACQSEITSQTPSSFDLDVEEPVVSPELTESIERFIEEHELALGTWKEEDGVLVCEGYMTRYEDQDFCSDGVPEDWVPFEFNGTTYYVQPLSETSTPLDE